MLTIRRPETAKEFDDIRALWWEYRSYLLGLDPKEEELVRLYFPEDKYAEMLANFEREFSPPLGAVRIVLSDDEAVGCGAYRAMDAQTAEIKRVFLRDKARGTGMGRALMQALIDQCRVDGRSRILMETGIFQIAAQRLYLSMGFRLREPYQEVPEGAQGYILFYEMEL